MMTVASVPVASDDSDATLDGWKYTITIDGNAITTKYSVGGSPLTEATPVDGIKASAGSWGFDEEGYGPFGSFYAAFDQSGNMVCHLDPYNLRQAMGGGTSVVFDGKSVNISDCNIMWCLPKHYVSVDGNTLTMSSSRSDGTVAKSFVIEGTEYNYLAIGVYEATYDDSTGKLGSMSGKDPKRSMSMSDFRIAADKSEVSSGIALIWNYHMLQTYRQCALAVMGNVNSQAVIGWGNTDGDGPGSTGQKDTLGPYYGTTGHDVRGVSCFIDDAWGSLWEYVDDAYWSSGGIMVGQNRTPTLDGENKIEVKLCKEWGWGTRPSTDLDSWGLPTSVVESHDGDTAPDAYCLASSGDALVFGGGWFNEDWAGISFMNYYDDTDLDTLGTRLAFLFDAEPTASVKYDHSQLETLLEEYGYPPGLASELPKGKTILGNERYDRLGDVPDDKGFRHVGWIIDGEEYPADQVFVKASTHTAKSVWVGLPAVTYDHSGLIEITGDQYSVSGLSVGVGIKDHDSYDQLPNRAGCVHVGWRVGDTVVGPTDPFVTRQSHTAVSLWIKITMVTFDHSNLTDVVGTEAEGVSELVTSMVLNGNPSYPQLPNTAGYRHTGWDIGGEEVGPTAGVVSHETHVAKSLWEKIPSIPIIPVVDGADDAIEIVVEKDSEPWLGKNGKSVLLVAIIVAIIAELAVLSISKKR